MSAPTEEQALAFAKYHAEHAAHGGAGREFHLRAETFLLELARVSAERDALRVALTKINGIRNSIIGVQGFNFSEHAYPLVAALNEAGFEGQPYPEARANVGTLLERTAAAEAERDAAVKERDEAHEAMRLLSLQDNKHQRELDAALAKVKALREALPKIQMLAEAVFDRVAGECARQGGAQLGREAAWSGRSALDLLRETVAAALASEVPPQPTTPATPTDKDKTR